MNRRDLLKAAGFVTAAVALLVALAMPSAAQACAFCDAYRVVNVAFWDVLNMRAGPSTRHRVIGAMPPDAVGVTVIGPCRGRWCPVAYYEKSGWVNMNYLQVVR